MTTQQTTPTPAAQAQYQAHQAAIKNLIGRLEAQLAEHAQRAAANPTSWGFAGDIEYMEIKLGQLVVPA
jgi:hypothetical protein